MSGQSPAHFEPNSAAVFYDHAAIDAMAALLSRARRTICISFYLFGGSDADRMIDALASRKEHGVQVRVLLDRSLGVAGLLPGIIRECRRAYRRLRALGIAVCLSDPRPLPDRPRKPMLWHHKYLVVDDREAMLGGMNIGSLFRRYHDLMVWLRGPVAAALGRQFDRDWHSAQDSRQNHSEPDIALPENGPSQSASVETTLARVLGTGLGRRTTEAALRQNICRAGISIDVAVCEMGRTVLLDELIACHRRGVSVRVLLCPLQISRLLPPGILNAGAVTTLLEASIPVHLYRLGPDFLRMHQKVALFDGIRAVTGSTNWTRSGFCWIGETDVELRGGPIMAQLMAGFEADWRRSTLAPLPPPSAMRLHALYERLTQ